MKFAPDQSGNGVYFENCCTNVNNAYYHFTGAALGNVFTFDQGQISFSLRSRYNLQQRATASSYRAVLDVRDNNPSNHLVYFITQAISGRLVLSYVVGGAAQYYYVPVGTEEELFGSGVTLRVALAWKGNTLNLYLNGTLVKSTAYTPVAANWSSASVFNLGAYEYANYGGYDSCDDVIGNFMVATSAPLLDTVTCNPASLGPAAVAACTVTMSGPVASATTIALMSTGAIAVPATVSIAANASSASFNATAGSFTQDQMASVTASLNAASTTASVALVAPSQITSLQCGSTSLAASASTLCTVTLSKAAPAGGTSVSLSSSLAALTVPASVSVPSGAISAAFTATAAAVTADQSVTVTAALGVSHAAATFSVIAPTVITSLQCSSTSLAASASTPCTVTLSKAASTGGTSVSLTSSLAALTVPASVLVPSGAISAAFTATAAAVTADQSVTVTAALGVSHAAATFSVIAPTVITSLECNSTSLAASASTPCTVTLSKAASTGGTSVSLSSSLAALTVPASVLVPSGATNATFTHRRGFGPGTERYRHGNAGRMQQIHYSDNNSARGGIHLYRAFDSRKSLGSEWGNQRFCGNSSDCASRVDRNGGDEGKRSSEVRAGSEREWSVLRKLLHQREQRLLSFHGGGFGQCVHLRSRPDFVFAEVPVQP